MTLNIMDDTGKVESKIHKNVLEVLGSHWNRKTRNDDTAIRWNNKYGKWECVVVRHLGFYDNPEEAGRVMRIHLEGVEAYYLAEMVDNDNHEMIAGALNIDRYDPLARRGSDIGDE